MFLKYLAKMDLILILSKFSGQIGPRPKPVLLCFIQQFDRSDRSGRVNREFKLRVIRQTANARQRKILRYQAIKSK